MKPNLRALASRAVMGAAFLSLTGAGVLMVETSLAQSTISGSWNTNGGGSWGTLGNWSYGQPMRPTAVSVVMNQGPLITVVRRNDKLNAIELQNVVGAGGAGYTKAPTVIISDPGTNGRPAIARANLDIDDGVDPGDVGAITSFTVLDPGSGYTGTITATVTREISGLLVTDAGSGYAKAPLIEFSGGGSYASNSPPTVGFRGGLGDGAVATAVITAGQVTDIVINNRGEGYSILKPPTISFVTTLGGSGAAATVALGVSAETFTIDGGTTTYSVAPTVTISSPTGANGVDATATANLDGSGRVTGITVTNPGRSFTGLPPTITFSGGTVLVAGVNPTGVGTERNYVIGGITRTANGSGYSNVVANAPVVLFSRPAPDNVAQGTAIVEDGRVIAVEINDGGINYTTPPQIIFSGGTGATGNGGVYATASISGGEVTSVTISPAHAAVPSGGGAGGAVATTSFSPDPEVAKFGAVYAITLNNSGQGYTSAPAVAIGATLRRTATATSVISGGTVTAVNIGNRGSGYITTPSVSFSTARWLGYTSAPRIRFVSGGVTGAVATATVANGAVSALSVTDGGGGYSTAPTVRIVGGNGTGAAVTAAVFAGAVTGLNVTNQGSSYGVAPTVVISGGGGSGAKGTANIAGGSLVSVTLTSPGTGYTSAPVVSIIPGDVADPAQATAVLTGNRVTGLNISHNGTGYSSVPTVVFTSGGVTFATATATVSAGRLIRIALTYPGSGYTTAPALNFTGGLLTGGTHATAVATVASGRLNDAFTITTPGGADPATATAVMAPNGTVDSISLVSGGSGYLSAPGVTIGDPTGVTTPVMLAPGGQGSYVQFNRDIGGNSTITLEDGRIVGSLSIGDTGGEDYTLNSGTGGADSSLSFSMGAIGGGKSFLNKLQGDQDVINAPIILTDELNARINAGRLTLNGGITGTGDLVLTGNSVLTIRGVAPTSNLTDLWLWNRGTTNTGAQIELGASGGPSFQNIILGNASAGTAGHAVLQLLEGRGAGLADPTPFYDQISDTARIIVDGVTNRWGYFKMMGADETIGSILDVGNALVLENMEGETINTDAVLTLGGDNLNSYIGGFVRNRSGGSGTGTMGLTKNGTGSLTLSGGNINYTGDTLLNSGTLRLINTTNFNSRIVAASGALIEVETTTGINFDNDVVGDAQFRKLGSSSISFNSGQMGLDNFFMTAGSATFRAGPSTLRGGENMIEKGLTVLGDNGADKSIRISDSLSVGFVQAEGRFGQTGSFFNVYGERLSANNRGYYRDGVLESAGAIEVTNMVLRMIPSVVTDTRVVTANTYSNASPNGTNNVVLNDVNNLILGSVMALPATDNYDAATRHIPNNTTIVAINPVTRTVTVSNVVKIIASTEVTFTFSSQTDGAVRGESLNFASVVHDGRKFVAVTSKGTIHTSLNGTTWTQVYEDVLGQPLESLSWTGERYVAVGVLGRVVTSGAGVNWVAQSSGISTTLRGVTGTEVSFTGDIEAGNSLVSNVSNASTFLPGMTIVGNATAPDTRIVAKGASGGVPTITIDSPALAAGTNVEFTYFKGTTNTATSTAATISNVRTAQHVPVGITLTTSQANGIPAGTTVLSVNGPESKVTLSQNASVDSPTVDLYTMLGDLTAGSDMITNMSNISGMAVGMTIKGAGVPPDARVTAIDTGAGTVTLDVKVPITRSAVALSIFTGRLQSGSPDIVDVTSVTAINVGMTARGRLLPANTKVLSSTANSITLTNQATGTVTGAALLAMKTVMTRTGDFSSGSATINNVSSTVGLVAGMPVSAPGVIPAGTTIQTVDANSITLTQQAISSPTGQAFNAGFDVLAVGDDGRIMASAGGTTNTWVSLPSQITRDLNAVTWNGSRLVAVGDNSEVLYSNTGLTWTRQTPPLTASENVIINRDGSGTNRTITLNNSATVIDPVSASFAGFKGTVSPGSSSVTAVTGIHILRPKLQIFAPNGLQAGVTVTSVNTTNNSAVLSSPATITLAGSPIQTFTALASTRVVSLTGVSISAATDLATKVGHGLFTGDSVTLTTIVNGAGLKLGSVYYVIRVDDNTFKLAISPADAEFGNAINVTSSRTSVVITPNPNILREVSDFKGLMTGMLLHGSGLSSPTAIVAMDKVARTITLASSTTASGRLGFGVLYGNLVENSTTVTNISMFPSVQAMSGRTQHLTVGKTVGPFPDRVPDGATISAFSSGANTITLSVPAIGTGYVPLYTLTGTTSNGSNVVTDVPAASFSGLAVNQQIYVTGTAEAADTFSVFTILALDITAGNPTGDIILSGPPSLNETGSPTVVYLGYFTGLVTTGDTVVRNLSNRLGVPPPTLFQPDLQDVVWTGTQFITVGGYGSIMTSADGTSWVPQDSATGLDLYAVGRSGSQFLAAGEDGLILKSANGSAWSVARVADDPAILDVRMVRDIQALVSTSTQTLALGSGGISSADGNNWGTGSVTNTFSGTQTFLTIAGRPGGGGGLSLLNEVVTSSNTFPIGQGVLSNTNNTNRIDDGITLQSRGGLMLFENNAAAGVNFSETIGKLLLTQGHLQLQSFQAGVGGTSALTFGSLEAKPGAVLEVLSRDRSSGSSQPAIGSIGSGVRNRVLFTQKPVLDDGIIGGFVTIDNEWATYNEDAVSGLTGLNSEFGLTRLPELSYEKGDQPNWTSTDNVWLSQGRALTTPGGSNAATMIARAINSLKLVGQTLNLDGRRLSIESGGILVTGNTTIQGNSANAIAGVITRGAAKDTEAVMNIINASAQLTLNTQIVDFSTVATTVNTAPIGATVVTLTQASVIGLLVGMEVTGGGAAIPAGTRIVKIDTSVPSQPTITLSVPLAEAMGPNTILSITGGPVSLAKSGGGLLVLGLQPVSNSYSGKTYLNNGITRVLNFDALGSAPSSFVADQIQLNGGTLQFNHITSTTNPPVEPDYNVALNDNRRGLTIGIAGGRLEVGVANPNNNASGTKVPQINVTISNPINAIGVLELAVRSSPSLLPRQTNSITLGTLSSANTYRAGIKTEALFGGTIFVRGNNEIGGIFLEDGEFFLEGNNNFTSSIRAINGDITINGNNTWKGSSTWGDPVDFRSGKLTLRTPGALGTGGLNLIMGDAAELVLAGVSQTIRQFTSVAGSIISNRSAPDGIVGATPVVFDLDRSQTYAGTIVDGVTISGTQVAALKLVKQGPGTLNLTNQGNLFSGGLEILGGAVNVTSIGNVNSSSALGMANSHDPSLLLIDKSVLSITPINPQSTNRSFTMGTGPSGATLVANGATQQASVTFGLELRDAISGTTSISSPVAFLGTDVRTLTLSGIGRGDNKFLLELGDSSATGITSLFKASTGTWVLGKSNTYSGLTTVHDGLLVVTQNDALGTKGRDASVNQMAGTFTSDIHLPNGTPVTFPLFAATNLPGGVKTDTQYYVVGSSGNSFQIATTPNGTPVALTSSGANVKFVPKLDAVRSTDLDMSTNESKSVFTGHVPNGSVITFNAKLGPTAVTLPTGLLTNTPYYVVNSENGTFEVSTTPGGTATDFSGTSTPDSLYYTTNAVGNAAAGVNLVNGTMELRGVDYITPEQMIFEGGFVSVPSSKSSSWAGDLMVNANARITVGANSTLTLNGNILGARSINQEGEGTVIMRGETVAAATNVANSLREYAVRAGTLVLDYELNNSSKLVDNAALRLGGTRRGGTIVLSGGSHEEIVGQLVLEAGASKIYREENSNSLIRLNNINRSTGSSLYVDGGRIAKADNINLNDIMGAWALIRDAMTHAFWVIPGTSTFSYPVVVNATTDQFSTSVSHVVRNGMVATFTSTGTLPGGIVAGVPYYVVNASGLGASLKISSTLGGAPVNITSAGTGTLTLTAQLAVQPNANTDTFSTVDGHGLANGVKIHVSSYGQLPAGLSDSTDYYVVSSENRSFRLSLSIDGPAVNFTTNGTGAMTVETQGSERRAGPAALTFAVAPEFAPASDGNNRVKVRIEQSGAPGNISATLTGQGTTADPYIYTITTTSSSNSNQAISSFVAGHDIGSLKISSFLKASTSASSPIVFLFPQFGQFSDLSSYGSPSGVMLGNGTYDNGSVELDWARNAGIDGDATTLNDGYIMSNSSYATAWGSTINTAITGDTSVGNAGSTFSVRFANQVGSTVSLLASDLYPIRTGGVLVSPTVGANDSTFTGSGVLTTENQGNLQNLLLHQYNEDGALIINNKITNRQSFSRSARLTGQSRRYLTMSGSLATTQVAPGWSLPVTTGINAGISANTRIENIRQNRLVILSSNHNGAQLTNNTYTQSYVFASPGAVVVNADQEIAVGHPARNKITSLSTTADITVGMSVTGPGIVSSTTVAAIINGSTVQLSQDTVPKFQAGPYVFTTGPTTINRQGVINDPNHFLITNMSSTSGLSVGMTVAGPGIVLGTTIAEVSTSPAYVRLSQIHDGVHQVGATFTFNDSIVRTGTLPTVVIVTGSPHDPNRRILDGVTSTADLAPGMTVEGAGLPAGTTVDLILGPHTIYLNQLHDGGFRRGNYTFKGGSLLPAGKVYAASVPNADRRIVMGVIVPAGGNSSSSVSTHDLYIGMPISGPGIPFGSTITFIYNESDIQVSTNHFFTAEDTTMTFTPATGVEKLGPGLVTLTGASDYTGVTFIADGTLRANMLTDGGVPGSLGASNGGSGNLVFNGGTLQYVGENGQTNRGFTVADFATLNIGHERTTATFSGVVTSGADSLNKSGPGTLELNGNANLAAMRVEQGRLLLQTVDTNPSPGTFSPSNFSQSALTSLFLGGGTLELKGAPEGSVTQNFGSQLTIEAGSTTVKVTGVPVSDPASLVTLSTRLNIMGQEEITPVVRHAGGTVHFLENPVGKSSADIFLYLPIIDRQTILPWATYQDTTNALQPGVNHFATVLQATSQNENTGGAVVSAGLIGYRAGSGFLNPMNWDATRATTADLNVSEGSLDSLGRPLAINGTLTDHRYVRTLRLVTAVDGAINIDPGISLEIVGGAILAGTNIYGGHKAINGPGTITGGALNSVNSDLIMHNYNPITPFTLGATIIDRTVLSANEARNVGKGEIRSGEVQMKIKRTGTTPENRLASDFFLRVRVGMRVSGPGIQPGTLVEDIESDFDRIILSLPATDTLVDQIFTFTDTTNFVQNGTGTTILAGNNTYTGTTFANGGVLRLDSANAVPGGIGVTGGTSALVVEDAVIGLGAGDFSRKLGTGISDIRFTGNGGFAAYGADRTVNLGGSAVPETLRFGNDSFVPDGASLILGSRDATHKLIFANPIDLSAFSQAIRVENSAIAVEAELAGSLSGLGRMIKFGLGTLRLGVSNANQGGVEIAEGRLIAANVANVFGAPTGPVRLGSSTTNTLSQSAVELVVEGGNVANQVLVGAVNSRGALWTKGGTVESSQNDPIVGEESSAVIVSGYPAVAYYDSTNQDLKYVRALDARGQSWGVPVTVSSRGNVGRNPSLQLINGNPAISYYDTTTGMLMYVRSTDAQGVVWGTPVAVIPNAPTAVAVQADGKILVGGSFTQFDGKTCYRLVRLIPSGIDNDSSFVVDPNFNAFIMNGEVRSILVLPDSRILVGGTFTAARENGTATTDTTRNRIAVFTTTGALDMNANPNLNGDVRTFVRQTDGKIMVCGSFTTVSGVSRMRLARLNTNITLDTSFGNVDIRNGEVRAVIPEDTNTDNPGFESYAIAGTFTDIRGSGRNRLARINADATLASTFNPDANNNVLDMVRLPTGRFLVGGSFTAFTGGAIARTRLARLNSDGSVDETFGQEVNGEVRDLHLEANGDVLVAGVFSQLGDATRNYIGRVLASGGIDPVFMPEPDNEVRQIATMTDGKIVMAGLFNYVSSTTQQMVARTLTTGAQDAGFTRFIVNAGLYSSLCSVNGNPAIAYYDTKQGDIYYIRSTDANGGAWPNPEFIDGATTNVGVGVSLAIGNIGGDLLTKDNRTTANPADDEVTLSTAVAVNGTPVIAYGDATNKKIKYVVANNVNGSGNVGVGLGASMTNWSTPEDIPGLGGQVGRHFTLGIVDGFPAITYQTSDTKDLMYIRALNVAGMTHNLRDTVTFEILRIPVTELSFETDTSWGAPVLLDGDGTTDDLGSFPSLALVNGRPTTEKNRPAVSYYDATRGDLKYVTSSDSTGAVWNAPTTVVSVDDVGRSNTLLVADGLPASVYFNATTNDLDFVILNNASGYSRIAMNDNTTWSGNVTLNGMTTLSPAVGTVSQFTGLISGAAGFRLTGGGTLNITPNRRQLLMTSLAGLSTGWAVSGLGIPAGAVIASIDTLNSTITLDRDHDNVSHTGTYTFTFPDALTKQYVGTVLVGNTFAADLLAPGQTTGPGNEVNGGVVIRSGALHFSGVNALSSATVELGDRIPQSLSVTRATNSISVLSKGGYFNPNHDGISVNLIGPGAFVDIDATIDGLYYGLTATVADDNSDRFTGSLTNGTAVLFRAEILPTDVLSDTTYYVRDSNGASFRIAAAPNGPAVDFSNSSVSKNVFYIEESSLTAQILVKDESANPERNGVYRVRITTENLDLAVNKINLVRVSGMDSVAEMAFGTRVAVSGGTSQGLIYYISSTISDRNVSAVHWVQEVVSDVSLLASASGATLTNAIDVNSMGSGVATILGASSGVTSGNVTFSGPITLQGGTLQDLQVLSSTSTGLGVRLTGAITESGAGSLKLVKSGSGVITLEGNNSFKGGIVINQGSLFVMNNAATAQSGQSGTGSGPVKVNAGALLSGVGTIGGPVTLAGTAGSPATLRPGDPLSATAATETLTINAPLVVGADSVVEFTLGVNNITRLVGTSMSLSTSTSKIVVELAAGFVPADGAVFDILDLSSPLSVFGGAQNLLNLLLLPTSKAWDTSELISKGIIKVIGDPIPLAITTHPVGGIKKQGESFTFNVGFTGSGPVSAQWQKSPATGPRVWTDIPGATGLSLTLSNLTDANDEARYRVRLTNPGNAATGGIYSNEPGVAPDAVLAVNWELSFAQDLSTTRVAAVNSPLSLSVVMNGEQPITYEWFKDGFPLTSYTGNTLSIPSVRPLGVDGKYPDAGSYQVRVKGKFQTAGILSKVCKVTVTSTDAVVVDMPVSQTVLAGTTVTLSGSAGGVSTGRVLSWKKGSSVILGETTETLILPNITVAQGGDYYFSVSNNVSGKVKTAVSEPAYVVVVDNSTRIVAGQVGKSVKLTALVGTPSKVKPVYQWLKDGQPLPASSIKDKYKAATNTLTINKLAEDDAATYTCKVKGAPGVANEVVGATHYVQIFTQAPEFGTTTPPPTGMVGNSYSWKIPSASDVVPTVEDPSPDAWLKTPLTYAVSKGKLPAGLKLDAATGLITGRPTAATDAATKLITFSLKNASSTVARTWDTELVILPLPAGIEGTFAGPIERSAVFNTGLGGRFDMTVLKTGAFTGKIVLGVEAARSFAGAFTLTYDSAGILLAPPSVTLTIPGTKTAVPVTISFSLNISGLPAATRITAASISYRTDSVSFSGWRNRFSTANPATLYQDLYNVAITLPDGSANIGNVNVPQGNGYATFKVAADGKYTLAGRTADNESLTGAYFVGPAGETFIFQTLYSSTPKGTVPARGSLLSSLMTIQRNGGTNSDDNTVTGTLDWVRPPNSSPKARLYKDGFGLPGTPVTSPVGLEIYGSRFILKDKKTDSVFGQPSTTSKVEFSEDGDYLPANANHVNSDVNPDSIGNVRIGLGSVVFIPDAANPTKKSAITTVSINHTNGLVTGSFNLVDTVAGKVVKRKATIMGLIVRERVDINTWPTTGTGYFILDQLPGGSTSPQRSGIFRIER